LEYAVKQLDRASQHFIESLALQRYGISELHVALRPVVSPNEMKTPEPTVAKSIGSTQADFYIATKTVSKIETPFP
jgi:hypothetical protein